MEDAIISEDRQNSGEAGRFQTCLRELAFHPGGGVIAAAPGKQNQANRKLRSHL